jgi:phosphomannomutase/phosphoglucomutase
MRRIARRLETSFTELPPIREIVTVDGLRIHFDEGWALVRASNTTPVLVTRYEAADRSTAERYQKALERFIEAARRDSDTPER